MSLFASAFETGVTAGPSTSFAASQSGKNKNKRKRPSHGGANAASSDDQLRAAQKNLERLMKSIDSSDVGRKEIQKVGRESMGLPSKKQKSKEKGAAPEGNGVTNTQSHLSKKQKKGGEGVMGRMEGKSTKSEESSTPQSKKDKEKKKKEAVEMPLPPSPAVKEEDTAGLTSMQKGMKAKLEGARFRWINEQLYTTPSTDAVAMMKKDPKIFADYHMTHRVLTAAWPSPPLPYIIERIDPLPSGTVIADLGCGDAGLAQALVPKGKIVLSYDLVSDHGVPGSTEEAMKGEGWVVQADFITHVPLPGRPGGGTEPVETGKKKRGKGKEVGSEIVDVVVCCLSLMGTNWVGGIHEACRILRQGGTFHVAEVTSRFVSTEAFVEKVESFGFKLEDEESPSTHFTLFKFTKTTPVPVGPVRGQKGWEKRVREGEEILQACVYKKR